jgi:alpha-mannosidase
VPVATAPAHRYVAVTGKGGGLSILVPGHCEYEWQPDGMLSLTLLRSVGHLSRGDLATRPGHAGWPVPTPGAQCLGTDRITFAVAPIAAPEVSPHALHDLWEAAFVPPSARWLRDTHALRLRPASVELSGNGLVLSAVKPSEDGDGIVLRCWNASEADVHGAWHIVPLPARAIQSRADEGDGDELTIAPDGRVSFTAEPRAMVTIRVT